MSVVGTERKRLGAWPYASFVAASCFFRSNQPTLMWDWFTNLDETNVDQDIAYGKKR